MFCKIFFFYNDNDWSNIEKHLENTKQPYQILTNNTLLNQFLAKKGIKCKTVDEIFPLEEDEHTYEINRIALQEIKKYQHLFQKVTFRGTEIFSVLESKMFNELVLFEKVRRILKNNENIIFVFKNFSFTYFALNRLSTDLGYDDTEFDVVQLCGNKLKKVKLGQKNIFHDYKNKFKFLQSIYLATSPVKESKRTYTDLHIIAPNKGSKINSNTNSRMSNSNIPEWKNTTSRKYFLIAKFLLFKILNAYNVSWTKILENVYTKIQNSNFKFDVKCAFFITPSTEYEYDGVYSVMEKFLQEKTPFHAFVFDLVSSAILQKGGISYIDLSEEAYMLTDLIKKSTEGKDLLEHIKKTTAENNLTVLCIGRFFNPIINEIFFAIAIMIICDHIFVKINFKSIVVAKDGNRIGNAVVLASKKSRILSYSIVSLGITKDPLNSVFKADKICIYGKQGLEALQSLGYEKDRIILTGNPRYDYHKKIDFNKQRMLLEDICHITHGRKIIIVGMGRWYKDDELWMSKLIKFCNKNNFEIIIKVHPIYKTTMQDEHEHKIQEIANSCKNLKYHITYDVDPSLLLTSADVVITDHSNFGLEAALLNKPWILYNIKNILDANRRYYEFGAALLASDYEILERLIIEILNEDKYVQQLEKGRKMIVDYFNFYNDGQATNRIYDLLVKE